MNNELEPARFLISDNRIIGDGYNAVSFMFGFFQLFNFLEKEEKLNEEQKERITQKLNRGAPVLVSHYIIIKDLFYKPVY